MRILLINPMQRRTQGYHTIGSMIPHLGLQVLAQRTPREHSVEIIDEIFGTAATEPAIRSGKYDLVGLTAYTSGAPRAYEIAALCRQAGIPTILGGPHAWACPDEAQEHCDSVAVGECDEIWPEILADAAASKLQPRYTPPLPELSGDRGRAAQHVQPINGSYDVACLQTSRGCPVGCEYCSVTQFNGPRIRRRDVEDIIEEWNSTPRRFIFVVDDNFFGIGSKHCEWAKELLRQIIRRGKKRLWFSQTTINMGDDPEALQLAYRAGCRAMLVGIETFNAQNLKAFHKGINEKNLGRYRQLVEGFHRAGIAVFGAFIVGGEYDTPQTVADTALEAVRIGVDIIQITNLTPLPGTKLFDRLKADGRILTRNLPADWERYTFTETVFQPSRMSPHELDEAIYRLRYAAATEKWVWKRTLRTLLATRSITTALFVHGMNKGWKQLARRQIRLDAKRFGPIRHASDLPAEILQAFRMVRTQPKR